MRIEKRFASVAVNVNCQYGRPKRFFKSSPTNSASSVGSISVIPLRTCFATASATTSGECPVIAPVSPRQRSTYSRPSAQVKCAPFACVTKTGKSPAHFFIQFIGTPPSSDFSARRYSSADRGCSATNRFASRSWSALSLSLLIAAIGLTQLVDDFFGRVCARSSRQPVARMRSGTTKEKPAHRCLVPRPIQYWPHRENLVECQFTVVNVPARTSVRRFEILRRHDMGAFDKLRQRWRIRRKRLDRNVREFPATRVPIPLAQLVWRKLEIRREHMFAFRRERGIENGRDRHIQIRRRGNLPVLRSVKRLLQVINFRPNMNASRKRLAESIRPDSIGKRRKLRQTAER